MAIKKISDLEELSQVSNDDVLPVVDTTNGETKKILMSKLITGLIPQNAGAHNGFYRGEDITALFYDGTLSEQIAAGTFNDVFIGDYIIGKNSGRKYLVADINYRLHKGDTECTTPHVLMIPELSMGTAQMNSSNVTTGAYIGSEMYTTNLSTYKTIIQNDFETTHIVSHRNHLQNAITDNYESGGTWYDSTIELMNENMVYGSNIFHNVRNGTNSPNNYEIDNSQLALFRLDKSKIVAFNDSGSRQTWWLRSVASSAYFCDVSNLGFASSGSASGSYGVRPAFLIY